MNGQQRRPIAVLALDAADYQLASLWGCTNMLLDSNTQLETDAYRHEKPLTLEVWPSIATGLHPNDHGISGEQEWENPILRTVSRITQYLPTDIRKILGRPFRRRGESQTFHHAGLDNPFDAVYGWPGITDARHLDDAWMWLNQARHGGLTEAALFQNLRANTGKEFGWLVAMSSPETPLIGAHSHILDVAGHVYADRSKKLQRVYHWVDSQLRWVRDNTEALVILSDHGMETSALGDDNPGEHSWRAMLSVTENCKQPLPESIYDVRSWLEAQRLEPPSESTETARVDTDIDHLRELGYIE